MTKVVSEEEFYESVKKQDTRLKFDGRMLVVTCLFFTAGDPVAIGDRVRVACAGPDLMMTFGELSRRRDGFVAKSYINTDESVAVVASRCGSMDPRPARVEVDTVASTRAREVWGEFFRVADGGD